MPLQRSPSNKTVLTLEPGMSHSSSSDLSDASYVPKRMQKRKRGDDLDYFMERMESMFNTWTKKQDTKYEDLLRTVHTIKEQNEGIVHRSASFPNNMRK